MSAHRHLGPSRCAALAGLEFEAVASERLMSQVPGALLALLRDHAPVQDLVMGVVANSSVPAGSPPWNSNIATVVLHLLILASDASGETDDVELSFAVMRCVKRLQPNYSNFRGGAALPVSRNQLAGIEAAVYVWL